MAQSRANNSNRSNTNNRRNTNSRSNSRSSNSSRNTSTRKNATNKPKVTNASYDGPTFADYWHEFSKSKIFKPLMFIVGVILIVLLDLLIAWNNFDRFFTILGVELLVISIAWVIGLVFNISLYKSNEVPDASNKDK